MGTPFVLPDLGEGIHQAEVLDIHVNVGQLIKEGDLILEVETDKAAVEIPSPLTGSITDILVQPGESVQVGTAMIVFQTSREEAALPSTKERVAPEPFNQTGTTKKPPVPASPSTRRLARELGVDLYQVTPTGKGGVVLAEDVHQFASSAEAASVAPDSEKDSLKTDADLEPPPSPTTMPDFSQWGEVKRIPFRSIRRATAMQMTSAWRQIPHVNCQDVVDVTLLETFRSKHKGDIEKEGGRLTLTIFTLKALTTALKEYPHFNASLDLATQEIIIKEYFNIGVAVDTSHGLVVPVIKDIDRKSIKELAIELQDKVARTRARKITREELQGGTFTLTNAGANGGSFFTPIINHPQIAILGLGQARMQPAVVKGDDGSFEIQPRLIMPIVISFDHRVVDGADALRFLKVIIDSLQDPDELLITMI